MMSAKTEVPMGHEKVWDDQWNDVEVADELPRLDFFGGRNFILKYLPTWGQVVEAGSGLGRYLFYLNLLKFDVVGVDVSPVSITKCLNFTKAEGLDRIRITKSDVRRMPFLDNSFSAYISLGVVEHFEEGPYEALKEAFRVIKPGGMAIISTPNRFALQILHGKLIKVTWGSIKSLLNTMGIHRWKISKKPFFQYEFSAQQLAQFCADVGFKIVERRTIDLKLSLFFLSRQYQIYRLPFRLKRILDALENTPLRKVGGLCFCVAYKPGLMFHCFFCGKLVSSSELTTSKRNLRVPYCERCMESEEKEDIAREYKKDSVANWHYNNTFESMLQCDICGSIFKPNVYYGNFGFSRDICPVCLADSTIRRRVCTLDIQQNWVPF